MGIAYPLPGSTRVDRIDAAIRGRRSVGSRAPAREIHDGRGVAGAWRATLIAVTMPES